MAYLLSDQELVDAALALHRAQEMEDQSAEGFACCLYVLLKVTDDTRAKLVANPHWINEDHSNDENWEEAQGAYQDWEGSVDGDWFYEALVRIGEDWLGWLPELRQLIRDGGRA